MAISLFPALRRLAPTAIGLCAAAAAAIVGGTALAEGFRIETKIFVGEVEKDPEKNVPVSQATTLFLEGAVYDFLVEPPHTAVFRKAGGGRPGRFILLNGEQGTRTELSTDQLAGAMEKLRDWASRQRDPFLQFSANPDFKEAFAPDTGKLILTSHMESYQVSTAPTDDLQALADYREFLDWYTRLNALLHAGPPPEARLRLNDALARHRVVPVKVELTRAGEKQPVRAEHEFTWRLSRDDFARIDKVRASLSSYRLVSNEEFVGASGAPTPTR